MEKPVPLRQFKSIKTSEMEDLIAAGHDIQYVTFLTKKASDIVESEMDFLSRMYFENALITYARPFASGVRTRLQAKDIFSTSDGALDYHVYLVEQRNKLVAHSVNPFEETKVGVLVSSDGILMGIGNLSGRLVAFTKRDYQQFNRLANAALEFINTKLKQLEQDVLEEASKLSSKDLMKLETVKFEAPGPRSVSKSKRKA